MSVANPYERALAAVPVREGSSRILGSESHYWDYGPEDAPVTILAVHGFRGEHHGLEPVIAHLHGIRVINPDLPGFGESSPMTEAQEDVEGYSKWLALLIPKLNLPSAPIILGHSFGSIVTAAAVAGGLSTPALILVNPIAAPALKGPKAFISILTAFYYRLGAALPNRIGHALLESSLITRFVTVQMAITRDPGLRAWIHYQHETYFGRFADRDTLSDAFRASTLHWVAEYAQGVHVPTLLIAAERDQITTVADEQKLADAMPDAELHVLDGVGHLIHYEKPAEAAGLIEGFLSARHLDGSGPPRKSTR
ncbi:MAG TPA: alpha/beta hydrolase [Galbitalea sp.]|jgi:pimeloyl-ACP methyl ester carboxylesterase